MRGFVTSVIGDVRSVGVRVQISEQPVAAVHDLAGVWNGTDGRGCEVEPTMTMPSVHSGSSAQPPITEEARLHGEHTFTTAATDPADTPARAMAPTLDEICRWPATVDIPKANAALGLSRAHGYALAQRGEYPARVLKVGGRYRVVTASIVRLLSENDDTGVA